MLQRTKDLRAAATLPIGFAEVSACGDNRHVDFPTRAPRALNAITLVAHDLRGPLASLRLLVEAIESYVAHQRPEKISSCANRACNIIDGLDNQLNSLLERVLKNGDPLEFDPEILDLDTIVRRAVESTKPMADDKAVLLLTRFAEPLRVRGDRQLLHQAIENLIGNAIKHSSSDTSITCSVHQEAKTAVLVIKDMGSGLSARDIQIAFRPFTTLSSKSADKTRSWGLGLWIVRLIVEQHGGTITVSSAGRGKGAAFSVKLPLYE